MKLTMENGQHIDWLEWLQLIGQWLLEMMMGGQSSPQWQHTVTRQKTKRAAVVPAAASKHSTAIGWGSLTTAVATSTDSFHRSIL